MRPWVVLFHFAVNLTGELLALAPRAEAFHIAGWWLAAVLASVLWGPQRLVRLAQEARLRPL